VDCPDNGSRRHSSLELPVKRWRGRQGAVASYRPSGFFTEFLIIGGYHEFHRSILSVEKRWRAVFTQWRASKPYDSTGASPTPLIVRIPRAPCRYPNALCATVGDSCRDHAAWSSTRFHRASRYPYWPRGGASNLALLVQLGLGLARATGMGRHCQVIVNHTMPFRTDGSYRCLLRLGEHAEGGTPSHRLKARRKLAMSL
jgi:hypothetical protein